MFTIDFNTIARVGKLVALLGFLLPWVTVSCSGTEIMTATGVQLMTGDPQPAGPLANMSSSDAQMEDAEPAALVIAACAAAVIGLAVSLVTRSRAAAAAMLATSLIAVGLSYASVENMRTEMRREIEHSQNKGSADNGLFGAAQQRQLSESVASSITVQEEEGYWLTLGGLGLAALFALMTLATRRREDAAPTES